MRDDLLVVEVGADAIEAFGGHHPLELLGHSRWNDERAVRHTS